MPKLKKTQNGGSYAIFYVPTFLSSKNQAWNLETRSASQLVKVGWELALSNHYSNWLLIPSIDVFLLLPVLSPGMLEVNKQTRVPFWMTSVGVGGVVEEESLKRWQTTLFHRVFNKVTLPQGPLESEKDKQQGDLG